MIMTDKDLLSEIKEVLNIETIFDSEDKTLEYQIKCITYDSELKIFKFLTHADKVVLKRGELIYPIHKQLVASGIGYIVEDYVEKMTLEQVEEILGYKIEIIDKN